MAIAKSFIRPPRDIGKHKTSRAERLEKVPEAELTKVIKAFEYEGAKVNVTRDRDSGYFIVEAFF